tara:strand:+ start:219 stop:386 length:168 start_codon:yes stop_codon:yes gene_type:complete
MNIIKFAIKNAFITGALTSGAFLTGAAIGLLINKEKTIKKLKDLQFKKNKSASIE